jgi:ABC-type sugar transport system substrate-binding protein
VDDAEVGRKLAEATAAAVGNGSIMVLHAGTRHPVYGPRLAAFEAELARFPAVEVFASIDCHMDPIEARAIMAERAERFPRLTAWVLLDDWPVRAAEPIANLLPDKCRIITFGCSPRVWPLIESGVCVAAVDGLYGELGARCVMLCELALSDSQMDSNYRIPTRLVTRENLREHMREWRQWAGDIPTESAPSIKGK